jgi:hypothetical protein
MGAGAELTFSASRWRREAPEPPVGRRASDWGNQKGSSLESRATTHAYLRMSVEQIRAAAGYKEH